MLAKPQSRSWGQYELIYVIDINYVAAV